VTDNQRKTVVNITFQIARMSSVLQELLEDRQRPHGDAADNPVLPYSSAYSYYLDSTLHFLTRTALSKKMA